MVVIICSDYLVFVLLRLLPLVLHLNRQILQFLLFLTQVFTVGLTLSTKQESSYRFMLVFP